MNRVQISILALVLGFTGTSSANDLGELTAQCDSCHGPKGASTQSDMPIIGGQGGAYISDTLESFRDWGRPCIKSRYRYGDTSRPKTDMCKIAGGLSAEDMTALSAHYSALPFVPAKQKFDAAMLRTGAALHEARCESCHAQGGQVAGTGPRLAGQWVPYLRSALKFVPTGEHLVPGAMERKIVSLSDEELDALMNFYASQQN